MARNIFYGGTLFSVLLFLALTFHTTWKVPQRIPPQPDPRSRAASICGKPAIASAAIPCWAKALTSRRNWAMSTNARSGLHQGLDQSAADQSAGSSADAAIHFTDQQLDDLVAFLKWTSEINTENWPPNIEG
jgi:nitric oxide reductase subunit C